MRLPLLLASALALAACTSHDSPPGNAGAAQPTASHAAVRTASAMPAHRTRTIAAMPDRGQLLSYTADAPVSRSAYTWHTIALSEEHALHAIATGTLEVPAPDGTTIALKYDHVVDHGDGNWTWVGRPAGAKPGTEAIITFGDKAVFGTVPYGRKPALRIASSASGRTVLMDTDPVKLAKLDSVGRRPQGPDAVLPPALSGARAKVLQRAAAQPKAQSLVAAAAATEANTVDVVIGYTNAFATRLGGTSQANTRLAHLVAVTNQALTNSQINGAVRLVGTVPVNYPDATDNEDALRALSGVVCTELPNGSLDCDDAPVPAALQPLVTARENQHADLMSLVRNFSEENVSCGIAWLVGGGEAPISGADAYAGISVVSDSNGAGEDDHAGNPFPDNGYVCRDETFAHELGHNMGSAHDATTAAGVDGDLTLDEHGRYPYSFGYKTDGGNFYTIMAYGDDGQTSYRVFSNPRINYCGGAACGTADADNAQSLNNTMPVVAAFYESIHSGTFDDVPTNFWAYAAIERLYQGGITGGCSTVPLKYCPANSVSRDSMTVFLLRAKHGRNYQPPAATGMFSDVPSGYWARAWIEQAAREGITGGCATSPARFCPTAAVARDQMAVMLLRARHGASYQPPVATGTMYVDVPKTYWAAAWVEQLSREGITGGCKTTPKTYCTTASVARDQMAVFLGRAFTF